MAGIIHPFYREPAVSKGHWLAALLGCAIIRIAAADNLTLSGEWRFALDSRHEGLSQGWFRTNLPDTIKLPGTTDEARKGPGNQKTNEVMHLSRPFPYSGPAWYQREVLIPEDWQGRRITLFLERTKDTQVWVDGQPFGELDSLATAHVYDLSPALTPGRHRLTLLVDNGKHPPVSGHQLSEDTQTDWNGVVGRVELRATAPVWLDEVQVYPDAAAKTARVKVRIGNRTGRAGGGTLACRVRLAAGTNQPVAKTDWAVRWDGAGGLVEFTLALGPEARLWDEFSPDCYELALSLEPPGSVADRQEVTFGLRDFATRDTRFCINGKTTFLRGKHDACVFPLTGYAPMDVASWVRVFKIAKSYGINHYRCHTWCPPEAAFAAADSVGIYLQPELPNFGGDFSRDLPRQQYTRAEAQRILAAFGNHPSFVMMTLGNELFGGRETRTAMVQELRESDPRHLYAQASNYEYDNPQFARGDDFWTTMRTTNGAAGSVRGSYSHADKPLGFVQAGPPATTNDYTEALRGIPVPVIGHEYGQYESFPDFDGIAKYTGVTRAWNLEVFRRRLAAAGLADQAPDFFRASGALAVRCYRADIEAALRTRGFGGFQMLDLQDFPGQGTALVGILDAFMDSKGFITPAEWREFCSETVPLVRLPKFTWTAGEEFTGEAEVANYGPGAFTGAVLAWSLTEPGGRELASGRLPARDLPQGALTAAGMIRVSLAAAAAPEKVRLTVGLAGTGYHNHYDLWVYPAEQKPAVPAGVTVARSLDPATLQVLAAGGKVLLLPDPAASKAGIEGFFASDFWCYPMFDYICRGVKLPSAPGTLGLLCDPRHPALAEFPTDFHSDWQWWQMVMHSRALILDGTPDSFRPIVQVIDNFARNHKLGLIFEARVGNGKLLVCGADLPRLQDKPEARQLLASLLDYAGSPKFQPVNKLTVESLRAVLSAQ